MRPALTSLSVLASAALMSGPLPAQIEAQHHGGGGAEAIVYRDTGFRGPAMAVSRADPDVRLAWPVTSVRVKRGSWQLCNAANYKGACITVTRDEPNLSGKLGRGNMLRSIRPVGGWGGGGGAAGGKSLRGMAAEFYPAPMLGNSRVLACRHGSATANCAAQTADAFCRSAGWTASARETMETVNRKVYLADVLCSRTGR